MRGVQVMSMRYEDKARVLLLALDEVLQVNWAMEDVYVRALVKGLRKIDSMEREGSGICEG
jgi:hypothetical protein